MSDKVYYQKYSQMPTGLRNAYELFKKDWIEVDKMPVPKVDLENKITSFVKREIGWLKDPETGKVKYQTVPASTAITGKTIQVHNGALYIDGNDQVIAVFRYNDDQFEVVSDLFWRCVNNPNYAITSRLDLENKFQITKDFIDNKNAKVEPISPAEADVFAKGERMDPYIVQAVNLLIKKVYLDGKAVIKQKDILAKALELKGISGEDAEEKQKSEWFEHKQMDIESYYEEFGWKVVYDKPGYSESYDSRFEFSKK